MKRYSLFFFYLCGICMVSFLVACSKEESEVQPTPSSQPELLVLFSPEMLGDNGYNDLILRGMLRYVNAHDEVKSLLYMPESMTEAEQVVTAWRDSTCTTRSMLVLAASDYVDIAKRAFAGATLDSLKSVLLFESEPIDNLPLSTFTLSTYGASWLAGVHAGQLASSPLVALANATDKTLLRCYEGFVDGFRRVHPESVPDTVCLAAGPEGFAMERETYEAMAQWCQSADFIFPIAGGSNNGVYRYLREFPKGRIFTVGMDVDRSMWCDKIIGNVIKKIDVVVENYLEDWTEGLSLPKHRLFGLESQLVEWKVSVEYETFFGDWCTPYYEEAVRCEKEYLEKKK